MKVIQAKKPFGPKMFLY